MPGQTGASSQKRKAIRAQRVRDFLIMSCITGIVFLILLISGSLGLVEAILSITIIGTGGLAYFVGTLPTPTATRMARSKPLVPESSDGVNMQTVIDALEQPAMYIDAEGSLAASNRGAQRVFQIPTTRQRPASAIIRRPELLEAIERAGRKGKRQSLEIAVPLGSDQIWRAEASRLDSLGGILLVMSDLSAVKRAERARADFLANASHELRTPLTSLAGFIETMQGPARDDIASRDRFLGIMAAEAQRMQRLIADLMSLSRIELDEHRRPDTIVDFTEVLDDVVTALRPIATERRLSLEISSPLPPMPILAIRDELIQVINNLVDNAMKYSPDGGTVRILAGLADNAYDARELAGRRWETARQVTLYTSPRLKEAKRSMWLRVEDTGPGIEPAHLPRLGERFYRVDQSRGGKIKGTGLGLAIVKHIVSRHGGVLAVESQPGRGTAFGIWMGAKKKNKKAELPAPVSQDSQESDIFGSQ